MLTLVAVALASISSIERIGRQEGLQEGIQQRFNVLGALNAITHEIITVTNETYIMETSNLRTKLLSEINLIPEDKLEELYNFIHYFRVGVEASKGTPEKIMQFAGSWNDMSDETFADLNQEIIARRQQAFSRRRSDETSLG